MSKDLRGAGSGIHGARDNNVVLFVSIDLRILAVNDVTTNKRAPRAVAVLRRLAIRGSCYDDAIVTLRCLTAAAAAAADAVVDAPANVDVDKLMFDGGAVLCLNYWHFA